MQMRGVRNSVSGWLLSFFLVFSGGVRADELAAPAGAPPKPGIYINHEGSPLIPLIDAATRQLDIEIYEMTNRALRKALRGALERGVRVRMVIEPKPVGGKCPVFEAETAKDDATCKDYRALVRQVNAVRGNRAVPFQKAALCGGRDVPKPFSCFQHGKVVVADRKLALVSTGNFNSSNLCDAAEGPTVCNRDYTVLVDDSEVVGGITEIIEKDIEGEPYELDAIVSGALGEKLSVSPLSLKPLISFITSARRSVEVQNQYLNDPDLNAALEQAARRGVKVSVMVSSLCAFGRPTANDRLRAERVFSSFDRAGIRTRLFTRKIRVGGRAGYLHAKAFVIDGERAWVGSVNGSTTSLAYNREFGVFLEHPDQVGRLRDTMRADFIEPASETWKESLECLKD